MRGIRLLALSLMVPFAVVIAAGCSERQSPALTDANIEKVSKAETLKDVEAVLGPGTRTDHNPGFAPQPGSQIRKWVKWSNGKLSYFVGLDSNDKVLHGTRLEQTN